MSDPDRDDARDAWLSEALRHAPDADAAPPSTLSAAILAEARAVASRPASIPSRRAGRTPAEVLRWFWAALARPPVAAAFASVMAATLVGLMWWDQPMDPTLPPPPAAAAHPSPMTPATAPDQPRTTTPAPAPEPAPSPSQVPAPVLADAEAKASPTAPGPEAKPGGNATGRVQAPSSVRKQEAPAPFPATDAPREGASERVDEAKKDATISSTTRPAASPPAETAPAARPAPAPSPVATRAAPLDAGRAVGPLRGEIAADRADKRVAPGSAGPEPASAGMTAQHQRSASAQREGADVLARERSTAAESSTTPPTTTTLTSPLTTLLDAVAREPQRWTREAAGGGTTGTPIAIDPAWRAWLLDVDSAVTGRWQRAGGTLPSADDGYRDVAPVRLFLDGRAAAILRLDGRTVRFDSLLVAPADHWQASLAPAAAARLSAGRARLAP